MQKPNRRTVNAAVVATTGAVIGVVAYRMGVTAGFKQFSLATELAANQTILISIQKTNPEILEAAVTETIAAIRGIEAVVSNA